MINKQEYTELTADKHLKEAITALLKRFTELDLTPSLDIQRIKEEYKVVLFNQLLKVDKGIKLRYELHRTENAKLEMINTLISLDGYEELNELQELISIYRNAFVNSIFYKLSVTPEQLIEQYKGDIAEAVKDFIIDLDTNEHYQKLKQVETLLNEVMSSGVMPEGSEDSVYHFLGRLMPYNYDVKGIMLDEVKLHAFLHR